MSPETKARLIIDAKLSAAGWRVQDLKQINLGAAVGVAVREYPTDTGPADYVLFIHREPVGVIEAKANTIRHNYWVDKMMFYFSVDRFWSRLFLIKGYPEKAATLPKDCVDR